MKWKIALAFGGLVIIVCMIGAGGVFAYRTRAVRFVKHMGPGLNLGNTLDATGLREYEPDADDLEYETSWGNPRIDAETFRTMKEAGFKTVRIPVTWEDHLDEEYRIAEPWLNRVQEVTDMALDEDLYVILDLHHDAWLDLDLEREGEIRDELLAVWGQIAQRFQNYDERLLFEAMNEPRQRDGEYEWTPGTEELRAMVNRLNEAFVETVRASGGNNRKRYLLLAPYANRHEEEALRGMELPDDNHVIVSVHMYTPHSFCQEEDGDIEWNTGHTAERIAENFQIMNNLFVERNVPVMITEFASLDKDNTSERVEWAKCYMEAANRYGIPCIWWDCREFALLDRESKTWRFPEIVEVLTNGQV